MQDVIDEGKGWNLIFQLLKTDDLQRIYTVRPSIKWQFSVLNFYCQKLAEFFINWRMELSDSGTQQLYIKEYVR